MTDDTSQQIQALSTRVHDMFAKPDFQARVRSLMEQEDITGFLMMSFMSELPVIFKYCQPRTVMEIGLDHDLKMSLLDSISNYPKPDFCVICACAPWLARQSFITAILVVNLT